MGTLEPLRAPGFICLGLLALAGGFGLSAQPLATKSYPIGAPGSLTFSYPATWKEELIRVREYQTNRSSTYDAIKFTPTNSEACNFLIELVPVNQTNAARVDLKQLLLAQGRGELTNSVETALEIHDLKGGEASGCYFRVTDRRWNNTAPPPGEFKYLTQGYARLGPMVLSFRLVADDAASEAEALEVIRTARIIKL
jgi:hypothetical protein